MAPKADRRRRGGFWDRPYPVTNHGLSSLLSPLSEETPPRRVGHPDTGVKGQSRLQAEAEPRECVQSSSSETTPWILVPQRHVAPLTRWVRIVQAVLRRWRAAVKIQTGLAEFTRLGCMDSDMAALSLLVQRQLA